MLVRPEEQQKCGKTWFGLADSAARHKIQAAADFLHASRPKCDADNKKQPHKQLQSCHHNNAYFFVHSISFL